MRDKFSVSLPSVSVIVPAYNCSQYLQKTIESILTQTFQNFEILIIDDGSTDNTREIISSIARRNPERIKTFYQENKGVSSARNTGIKEAKGEYIAFLDADDLWIPEKLEKQLFLFKKNQEADFIYTDCYFTDEKEKEIPDYPRTLLFKKGNIFLDLFLNFFIITSGVIVKKKDLDKIGFFNESFRNSEDYDYFLKLAYSFKADYVKEKLFKRRVIKTSLSHTDFTYGAKNDLKILYKNLKNHPQFYKQHQKTINKRLSDYHFALGYHYLEKGENILAFNELFHSIIKKTSLKTLKNLIFCLFPLRTRKSLKRIKGFLGDHLYYKTKKLHDT